MSGDRTLTVLRRHNNLPATPPLHEIQPEIALNLQRWRSAEQATSLPHDIPAEAYQAETYIIPADVRGKTKSATGNVA